MNWVVYALVLCMLLVAQTTIAPHVALLGSAPNWLLTFVVFLGLFAPAREALIGAFAAGVAADLLSIERFGVLALGYILAAYLVLSIRDYVFRQSTTTQFVVTMAVCLILQFGWMLYHRVVYSGGPSIALEIVRDVFFHAVYTAVWSVPLHRILMGMCGALGIATPRYNHFGLHRVRRDLV